MNEKLCYNRGMKYAIFDFNGTILDDFAVSLKCINFLLAKYLNEGPIDRQRYLEVFTFPVIDYYRALGFDFDRLDYDDICVDFISKYESLKDEYRLMEGAVSLFEHLKAQGYRLAIISASKEDKLRKQCDELGISGYFETILGTKDIKGGLKEDIAFNYMQDKNPSDCIYIGDTLADLKIADALGIRCYLLGDSHQSKSRLLEKCANVYDSLKEIETCLE